MRADIFKRTSSRWRTRWPRRWWRRPWRAAARMFLRIGIVLRKLCLLRRECIAGRGTFITRLRGCGGGGGGGGRGTRRRRRNLGRARKIYREINCGRKSYTQPLTVKMDPQVKAPLAELQRQFDFVAAGVREISGSRGGARRSQASARANCHACAHRLAEIPRWLRRSRRSTRKPLQ